MEPVVSIILPVYNAEETLSRCIGSILGQRFTDFELLVIDDGSQDGSAALCDSWAEKDRRIRVFHRPNAGVSAARNFALDRAQGTYLQFLDSDDWITPDATALLVHTARQHRCDLVVSDFYRVIGSRVSRKGDIGEEAVLTREEYAAHMMENPADFYYGVLWNKLYRRDIVERHHLRMDPNISWCEDFMFNLDYLRRAERFCALQVPIYYYVKTKGSLANQSMSLSRSLQMKRMIFSCYDHCLRCIFDEAEYEKSKGKIYRFLIDAAGDGAVPPLLPGTRKLGDERMQVCPETLDDQGPLADIFRERKLLERCLEPTALRYDLSRNEIWLLLALRQESVWPDKKTLADFLNISRSSLTLAIQKLSARELIAAETAGAEHKGGARPLRFRILPEAGPIMESLEHAQEERQQTRLDGLSEEEMAQLAHLSGRIRDNIRRCLS